MANDVLDSQQWRYHMLGAKGDDRTHDWIVLERSHDALLARVAVLEAGLREAVEIVEDLDDTWLSISALAVSGHRPDVLDAAREQRSALKNRARALLGGVPAAAPEPLTARQGEPCPVCLGEGVPAGAPYDGSVSCGACGGSGLARCGTCGSTDRAKRLRFIVSGGAEWDCVSAWHDGETTE
jgi:hypothetical protein